MPRPTYPMTLTHRELLAPKTLGLTFQVENPPTFEAGQFISIQFTYEGENLKRSYSIASTPEQLANSSELTIAVGLIDGGKASACFQAAQLGQTFEMSGPFGLLTLSALAQAMPKRLILIGTGTGVAPYHSMLPELQQLGENGTEIYLLMGVRQQDDLFYEQAFQSCSAITFASCLSRATDINRAKGQYAGYVQEQLMQLKPVAGEDIVYLCGLPQMIDDCVALLTEQGFGPKDIKREKYTFSR